MNTGKDGEGPRTVLKFSIPIEPKSMQHGVSFNPRARRGQRAYVNKDKILYTDSIVAHARFEAPVTPMKGPVQIEYTFYLKRPKRLMRKKDPDEAVLCDKKPDVDNLIKGTQDGLTKSGFWEDDSQIVCVYALKLYHEKKGRPRIEVQIQELNSVN